MFCAMPDNLDTEKMHCN